MPQMEQVFHTSAAAVQYTMVTFLVGFALGQSLYGPITDRFGRKPPLYFSLMLFIVSSAACAFAPSIRIMSFVRLLQAIGACGGCGDLPRHREGSFPALANCAAFFRCWFWWWAFPR